MKKQSSFYQSQKSDHLTLDKDKTTQEKTLLGWISVDAR